MVYSIGIFSSADPSSLSRQREPVHARGVQQFPKGKKYNNRGEGNIKAGY